MSIEFVADDGQRLRIPRGWVILTLALAAWGLAALIGVAIWGLLQFF